MRKRERKIGNTIYTVIAREKEGVKESSYEITKRLIEKGAKDLINQPTTIESLEGCNSGGKK